MVPIGAVATFEDKTGPYRVTRYNLFRPRSMMATPRPAIDRPVDQDDGEAGAQPPAGFATEWTDIAFQQKRRATSPS